MSQFLKDPDAILDYKLDFAANTNGRGDSDWLADGETIVSHEVDADSGITVDSSALSDSDTSVTVWLSGGVAGQTYSVRCEITTSAGRVDERTMTIRVEER